jgi:choline dehydrogenase-like flavoprotein
MTTKDFVIIGSGGGGGTIAWLLAKAGFSVELLEQGADWSGPLIAEQEKYSTASHDEYRFRIERPELKRRLRGDYNTFRESESDLAKPFSNGWTGSQLGGGTVLWGGWGFRALPIDYVLKTPFRRDRTIRKAETVGILGRRLARVVLRHGTLLQSCGIRFQRLRRPKVISELRNGV